MVIEVMEEVEETDTENDPLDPHLDVCADKILNLNTSVFSEFILPNRLWIISLFTGLLAALSVILYGYLNVGITYASSVQHNLYKCIISKQNAFPSQDLAIWADIPANLIYLNQEPSKPAVYLLLFEKEVSNVSACIIELITTCANNFVFHNDKWLFLNGSKLSTTNSRDPVGALIETLSTQMNEHSKVLVVTDIQKVSPKLARGFHFLVDEHNPKVKDAVYIFTLPTKKLEKNSSPFEVAQDELIENWRELDSFELHPLVTRLTIVVVPVKQENETRTCPLKIKSTVEISIP